MAIPTPFGLTTPGSSLGENFNTDFETASVTSIVSVQRPSTQGYGFTVPSMSLQYQASTFIYTKASPIVINEDPVQIWYIS